jgi:hypothetical protein
MAINILLTVLGVFAILFVESLLVALFNFRVVIVLFLFLFKKIDWKPLLVIFGIISLLLDVVNNLPLGSNLLIISVVLGILMLSSVFFSLDSDITAFLVKFFVVAIYYILLVITPNFLVTGRFGFLSLNDILSSIIKAVVTTFLFILLENIFTGFRSRGNASQIRLK